MVNKVIPVVGALIIKNKKIFIAQRKSEGVNYQKWEFPGGKIEPGESEPEALVREIKEELAWQISVGEKLMTSSVNDDNRTITLTVYYAKLVDEEKQPTLLDHLDFKWVTAQELNDFDFPLADIPIVRNIISKELPSF